MALATLSIDLVAKIASFERDLKTVASASEAQSARIAAAFGTIKTAAASLGGVAVGGLFVGAIRNAADYADEIGKTSQKIGVATEAFSGLSYAAKLSDVSQEALANGLKKLSVEIDGGGAKLKTLGISTLDAGGKLKSTDTILAELADEFAGTADGATKTANAVAIFGKSGSDLIPLLNGGGQAIREATEEARRFGLVVSGDAAKAAEQFNDDLTRLQERSRGFAVQLSGELLPVLNSITGALVEADGGGAGLARTLGAGLSTGLEAVVVLGRNVVFVLEAVGREIGGIAAQAAAVARLDFKGAAAIGDALRQDGADARKALDLADFKTLNARGIASATAESRRLEEAFNGGAGKRAAPSIGGDTATAAGGKDRAAEALLKERARLRELDTKGWVAYAEAILSEDERLQAELRKIDEDANKERDKLRQQDLAGWVAYADAIIEEDFKNAQELAKVQIDALEQGKEAGKELGLTFSSALEDALVKGENLRDVIKGLGQDILRIAVRKNLTEPLSDALGQAVGTVFGGGNSGAGQAGPSGGGSGIDFSTIAATFAKVFGFASGGVMTGAGPLPLRAYASGGIASSPQMAIFGEGSMPEAYVPLPDGRRIPVNMRGGGGTTVIQLNQTIGDLASKADVEQASRLGAQQALAAAQRSASYGGELV